MSGVNVGLSGLSLLLAAAISVAGPACADEIPQDIRGIWCLSELGGDNGELQIYRRGPCRGRELITLRIIATGMQRFIGNTPSICVAPSIEPTHRAGWFITFDCGGTTDVSPVTKVNYFIYPMTKDRIGVRLMPKGN